MLIPLKCQGAKGVTNPSIIIIKLLVWAAWSAKSNLQFPYHHNVLGDFNTWIHLVHQLQFMQECPNVKLINGRCKHKGHLYVNFKKKSDFTKVNIFDVHAKFAWKWQLLNEVNILTWAPKTTNYMTNSHFDIFLHILIINRLHGSRVYA
jgi:hypothetical protein